MKVDPICSACSFFEQDVPGFGICRRLPPGSDQDGAASFPYLADTEWCGEFVNGSASVANGNGTQIDETGIDKESQGGES